MISRILLIATLLVSSQLYAVNKFHNFTRLLIGEEIAADNLQYNQMIQEKSAYFKEFFVKPISEFSQNHLKITGKTLFYPFAGADASYPLLLFPNLEQYVLIGLEIAGNPNIVDSKFDLPGLQPQAEGFLRSGFFKTMNMSAQIHHQQGVIPMLVMEIGILGGMVENISIISEPFRGIAIDFTHNNILKKLYYFRANLDDSVDKINFFAFLKSNHLLDNCMLKASSYKLHQFEFKQLLQFTLDNCASIIQDDTGVPISYLQKQNREITLFGNYINPYGEEFKPYYQKELARLYSAEKNKIPLTFCYGYGCGKTEANLLLAKKSIPTQEIIKTN